MCWTLLLSVATGLAQEARRDTVVVTGTAEPLPLEEVDRAVVLLPAGNPLLSCSLPDLLRADSSIGVQARAPGGVQSDISIRGAGFGQTLILVNGQRMNDVQTGHHNMDIPVPLEAVSRIEVLHGSGSTLYGSDAIGGVVNIITKPPESAEVRLRAAAGNFGVNAQGVSLSASAGPVSERLVAERDFSSGFRPDRDYRNLSLASMTHARTAWGSSDLTLAYSDRPFGADQFYGNFNSWENTKSWFSSVRQQLGENTEASFTFRRHSDWFVLFRDRPAVYANHHSDESWLAALRRRHPLGSNAALHWGLEGIRDSIVSSNLGTHARQRAAAYVSAHFHALGRFSLSLGAREEVYRKFAGEFSPTGAAGVWLTRRLKLRAGASRSFRVPTYTDLYYSDPANLGSPNLRPERAWSYEGGLDWNAGGRFRAALTAFGRSEKDGIDYVRRSPAEIWRAANIEDLRFTGAEASASVEVARANLVTVAYTALHGAQAALAGLQSKYVFNYPSHSASVGWQASFRRDFLLRTRLSVLNRRARDPYALWDCSAAWAGSRVHPFVQWTNLTATHYEEIAGVVMPGRAVRGGMEIVIRPAAKPRR